MENKEWNQFAGVKIIKNSDIKTVSKVGAGIIYL